ncbi:MAG: flavodoxin family protein, partial [Deltaproteobacteria bacterium]|nr:flavodoxin family protein [Deltaproteobacteria bacterium]
RARNALPDSERYLAIRDDEIRVIALAGSPRRGGSSDRLLDAFVAGAGRAGAAIERLAITDLAIAPCNGCDECEARGECVIADDHGAVAHRVQDAHVFAISTPVYFSGFPGMTKNLVDRFQAYWARRYRLGRPERSGPVGYLLATGGAPSMKNFDGVHSTFKYLMQAVWGRVGGSVTVPNLDAAGAIGEDHEAVRAAREMGFQSVRQHREGGMP